MIISRPLEFQRNCTPKARLDSSAWWGWPVDARKTGLMLPGLSLEMLIVIPVKTGIQLFQRLTGFPLARERRKVNVLIANSQCGQGWLVGNWHEVGADGYAGKENAWYPDFRYTLTRAGARATSSMG